MQTIDYYGAEYNIKRGKWEVFHVQRTQRVIRTLPPGAAVEAHELAERLDHKSFLKRVKPRKGRKVR